MANPVLGKSLCSDWFFLGQDFAVRTVSMETVQSVYFCFGAKPANATSATKTAKKCENCHSSHWNYPLKLKRLKFFRNFKDGWRWTFFKCKPPEVHFTIRNRVPYNKLLTNRACSGRTGEYWPSVVFVRTSLRSVRTVTTSGQYSPVRPSRSVSKRLVIIKPVLGNVLYDAQYLGHAHNHNLYGRRLSQLQGIVPIWFEVIPQYHGLHGEASRGKGQYGPPPGCWGQSDSLSKYQ